MHGPDVLLCYVMVRDEPRFFLDKVSWQGFSKGIAEAEREDGKERGVTEVVVVAVDEGL